MMYHGLWWHIWNSTKSPPWHLKIPNEQIFLIDKKNLQICVSKIHIGYVLKSADVGTQFSGRNSENSSHTHVHTCTHPCISTHTCAHPCIYTQTHAHLHTPTHTRAHPCTPAHTHAYPRIPAYTRAYPRIPAHTQHTCAHPLMP